MIIQNGYMEKMVLTGGGTDPETGYLVEERVTYGTPIPCQYLLKSNRQAVLANGERVETVGYQILVEEPLECCHAEQVRLCDLCGNAIGVFVVETVERLEAVSEVSITVKPSRYGNQA